MKNLLLFFLSMAVCVDITTAQDKPVKEIQTSSDKKLRDDTTHISGWRFGGVVSLNVGQGSSRNWAAGAEEFSFSTASYVSLWGNLRSGRFRWFNTLDLGYALVNTSSQGVRKNDDKIDFYSKPGYDISKTISLATVVNFRSQFRAGFDYDYLDKEYKRKTSAFMAPAYLVIAPGIDWHPVSYFNLFFSPISVRMVFVTNDPNSTYFPDGVIPVSDGGGFELPLATLYGVDPGRKVRTELGGFLSANFNKEIFKNVKLKSRFDLYSNYLESLRFIATGPGQLEVTKTDPKPQNIDVLWTTVLALKVNKWLNVTYNFDLIYDDDVRQFGENKMSPATQFRSLLTVGVQVQF